MVQDVRSTLSGEIERLRIDDNGQLRSPATQQDNNGSILAMRTHSHGVVSSDITLKFKTHARELDIGQLIKDEEFTLFESVGALEIMDPKTDSGCLAPGELLFDAYDTDRDLFPEEVLGIIDQLFCHEMAWHMGQSLSQTLFTSLYLDRILDPEPSRLSDINQFGINHVDMQESLTLKVLRAYCLGLLRTCWHVNNRIKSEHYYEEEDFCTHTFQRNLLERVDDDDVIQLMEETVTFLDENSSVAGDFGPILYQRLAFRLAFLKLVRQAHLRDAVPLRSLWRDMSALLEGVKSGKELAKSVPSAFSPKLQRKLASTVPPRPIIDVGFEAAYAHMERLCKDGIRLTDVLDHDDSQNILTFVFFFQSRDPQPSVYIRTLLQYYLFGDMIILGKLSVRQLLDNDIGCIVLPADQVLDRGNDETENTDNTKYQLAQHMERFRLRAAQAYLDILRTLCQNRCRVRRTLCHTICDWESLQTEAEVFDNDIRQLSNEEALIDDEISSRPVYAFPLSSWAYYYKLRQMEWIVQIGFELDMYQPDELSQMYCHLHHLAQTRVYHLQRIRSFVSHHYRLAGIDEACSAANRANEYATTLSFLNYGILEATATEGLADALSCLYTVLERIGVLAIPDRPYSEDSIRYELRMKPFHRIPLPRLPTFPEFDAAVKQDSESTADLLRFAVEASARAKRDFELLCRVDAATAKCKGSEDSWRENVQKCMKASILAGISSMMAEKAFAASRGQGVVKLKVELLGGGQGYHSWWTVPKLTPIT